MPFRHVFFKYGPIDSAVHTDRCSDDCVPGAAGKDKGIQHFHGCHMGAELGSNIAICCFLNCKSKIINMESSVWNKGLEE